jgi:hypothetical protein
MTLCGACSSCHVCFLLQVPPGADGARLGMRSLLVRRLVAHILPPVSHRSSPSLEVHEALLALLQSIRCLPKLLACNKERPFQPARKCVAVAIALAGLVDLHFQLVSLVYIYWRAPGRRWVIHIQPSQHNDGLPHRASLQQPSLPPLDTSASHGRWVCVEPICCGIAHPIARRWSSHAGDQGR